MSKFLVTGGAGFIGSHISNKLVKDDHFTRILDNFSSGKMANLEGITDKVEIINGDIRSLDDCLKATKGIDFVLHQAALEACLNPWKTPRVIMKLIFPEPSICFRLAVKIM